MTFHFHECSKCKADLGPCVCRNTAVHYYRCEECEETEQKEGWS